MKSTNNIRIFATKIENNDWLNIYLDFSGQTEYLMSHRPNEHLYAALRNSIAIDDLMRNRKHLISGDGYNKKNTFSRGTYRSRNKHRKSRSQQLENQIDHLILVINEYIEDRRQSYDTFAINAA